MWIVHLDTLKAHIEGVLITARATLRHTPSFGLEHTRFFSPAFRSPPSLHEHIKPVFAINSLVCISFG